MAGFRELLAVEWDKHAASAFAANFPEVPLFHGDIADLSVDEALHRAGIAPGELDVFDGSPPCQGFSTSGKRLIDDPRNQLFREYIRLLKGLRPKVLVMENVSGMVKGKMKLIFADILRELKASGYTVRARLMNAMYFNVPQSRERMIFIGTRTDLAIRPSHPSPESIPYTVREAWAGLPDTSGSPRMRVSKKALSFASMARQGDSASTYHPKHHFFNLNRLAYGKPSRTITKQLSPRGMLMHPERDESISVEEAKRIGSFPDGFTLPGKIIDQWARVGNSVPPLLMRSIARHIKTTILGGS